MSPKKANKFIFGNLKVANVSVSLFFSQFTVEQYTLDYLLTVSIFYV